MNKSRFHSLLTASLILAPASAAADVTIEQSVRIDAGGALSVMNASGSVTTMISGNHSRMENAMEPGSKMVRAFAKNLDTATIVRLDDEKLIQLMPEDQTYSEVTFEQMRTQMEQGMAQLDGVQGGGLPVDESECQWSEPVVNVQKTRNREKFAGVKARQTLITASQSCTVPDTGKRCDMNWTLEYWNAKKMPGADEAMAFQQQMAEAMGGDELAALAKANTRGLLAMFKGGWDEVLSESGELEGYPVKTVMSLEMGGEHCTMGSGQPIAMDEVWSEAADAAIDAAAGSAAGHAGAAVGEKTAEALGDSVGGSIAGSAIGAASQKLIGGAFGKFRNRDKEEKAEKPADPATASVTLFTITTELTAVSEEDVPAGRFNVPEGWSRVESISW